jgi:hypothetical protein
MKFIIPAAFVFLAACSIEKTEAPVVEAPVVEDVIVEVPGLAVIP